MIIEKVKSKKYKNTQYERGDKLEAEAMKGEIKLVKAK